MSSIEHDPARRREGHLWCRQCAKWIPIVMTQEVFTGKERIRNHKYEWFSKSLGHYLHRVHTLERERPPE